MKGLIVAVIVTLLLGCRPAAASLGSRMSIALWPGTVPDQRGMAEPEYSKTVTTPLVAGRPWTEVGRVSRPTLTMYFPSSNAARAAILVFPGGGYEILAIDLEGTEVCDRIVQRGIACGVLKYRVPGEDSYPLPAPYPKSGPYPESPIALEDAQRALRLIRHHAAQWHVDPHKIGVVGFSAGGHLVAAVSNHFNTHLYRPVDAADHESARPDFAAAIYPGHLEVAAVAWDEQQWRDRRLRPAPAAGPYRELQINPDIRVTSQTPPTFLLQAQDDDEDNVDDALAYYIALKHAHVATEMHLYPHGGHAFGVRRTSLPITQWPELMYSWLRQLRVI